MRERPFLIHAMSPLHAGIGRAADVIDLPTARMKATGIPFLPGSSIKGVLRDARSRGAAEIVDAVFGPAKDPSLHAGALIVGDGRLLALPVRSFRGAFAWATSPLLLTLAGRDWVDPPLLGAMEGVRRAWVVPGSISMHKERLFLEDLDLPAVESEAAKAWAHRLAPFVSPGEDIFSKRFVIVDDDTMAFLWETATQVDARVRIDGDTRTVAKGALWLEESLPPETLLIGIMAGTPTRSRAVDSMSADAVLDFALPTEQVLQFGGKATVGRGRCRIVPLETKGGPDGGE